MEYLKVLPSAWGGAARACAASRTTRQAVDMVQNGTVRYYYSTVRYSTVLYSSVKSYSTYGMQQYGTQEIRYAVVRYCMGRF